MRRKYGIAEAMALAATAAMLGCGGGSAAGGSSSPPENPEPPPAGPQAKLDRVAGCDELTAALRSDATYKISVQADELRAGGWTIGPFGGGRPNPPPVPAVPEPGPGSENDPGDAGGGPDDFTDTNVQVEGVDEADFVETDGERIYLLHGDRFVVVDSWPPQDLALETSTPIEGSPIAMFVADGRAAIFSYVYDEQGELHGADVCHYIDQPFPRPIDPFAGDFAPCFATFTKLTLLDLSGTPEVVRELYLEGSYTAARRHDSVVRLVVQGGLGLPVGVPEFWTELYSGELPATTEEFLARVDAWEQRALAAVAEGTLDEWLPTQWERVGETLVEIPPLCTAVRIPPVGASEHGMTRVLSLDMAQNDGELHDALVVGNASDVYAGLDRLVLAQREWQVAPEGDRTALHVFSVGGEGLETTYLGSGYVPGVPKDQFSFDVKDDVLRVATTRTTLTADQNATETTSQIVTARVEGDALSIVGTTGPLAPGERIFSSRYVGDRGYLVTFRQIDPLFVVDLSDPANPTVLGELELPGFSEYMHPLGEHHLLTIGRDANLDGTVRGLALRIFDVADDASPKLTHLYRFAGEGWSDATTDHRSFIFDAGRGLLTFPYVGYSDSTGLVDGGYRSVLAVLSVDVDAGIELLGEVDHTALVSRECGPVDRWACAYPPQIRRGLFIEDFLYSISGAGILTHASADLSNAVGEVVLPEDVPPVLAGIPPDR